VSASETRVADGVFRVPLSIVNAYLIAPPSPGDRGWVLVDAGLSTSRGAIVAEAAARFGPDARPSAILLTHGHFDHVGSLEALAAMWDVPVYAHPLEMPYLTGRADYPPPDPSVGGGAMAWLSPLYSRRGTDLGRRARELPADGAVPFLSGWRWVHTPGHTPGHPHARRRRLLRHHQAGVVLRRPVQAGGGPRPARVLHRRLGTGPRVGPAAGEAES
jgi:glyoxylase-like metal-dependent hydrolase (beta-lactamase superfamily II)